MTRLSNGWTWAVGQDKRYTLCPDGCGEGFDPSEPPPISRVAVDRLPVGVAESCGNTPDGRSWWLGEGLFKVWSHREATSLKVPWARPAGEAVAELKILESRGRIWVRDADTLWSAAWSGSLKWRQDQVLPWPTGCRSEQRRVDHLLYVAPSEDPGLASGVWSLGPCGLVPVHLFGRPGRAESILFSEELAPIYVKGVMGKENAVVVKVKSAAGESLLLQTRPPYQGYERLTEFGSEMAISDLFREGQHTYIYGQGLYRLEERAFVPLRDTNGRPLGKERLSQSLRVDGGRIEVIVTEFPDGIWGWGVGQTTPRPLTLPSRVLPHEVTQLTLNEVSLSVEVHGKRWFSRSWLPGDDWALLDRAPPPEDERSSMDGDRGQPPSWPLVLPFLVLGVVFAVWRWSRKGDSG